MSFRRLSEKQKMDIICFKDTKSIRLISDILNISKSSVHYTIQKFKKYGQITNRKSTGAPKKILGRRIERKIIAFFRKNPETTINQANLSLNLNISNQTLKTFINSQKFYYFKKPVKPYLYNIDKAERIEFAQSHLNSDWSNALFLDETSLEHQKLYQQRIWRRRGTLYQNKRYYFSKTAEYIKRYTKFIAYISNESKNMIPVNQRWSGNTFVKLLPKLFDGINLQNKRLFLDNDTCHHDSKVFRWCREKGIEIIYTPKRSPDTQPIENFFFFWKKRYYQKTPKATNIEEIKTRACLTFAEIDQNTTRKFSSTMDKRLEKIISSRGEITKY